MMLSKETIRLICEKYYNDIYKFCLYKTKNPDNAADITQETFLLLQQKNSNLTEENIKTWLIKTADNKIHEHFRSLKKVNSNEINYELALSELEKVHSFDDDKSQSSEDEFDALVDEVSKKLKDNEKQLFYLRFIHKMKYGEIAKIMNSKEKTVQVQSFRLKIKLNKIIQTIKNEDRRSDQ